MFNLSATYFSLGNPFAVIDRWLNPYGCSAKANIRGNELKVMWTRRADRKMKTLGEPLNVDMQLYFSCVVTKRVLFHQQGGEDYFPVNKQVNVAFRLVQSTACDPEEFAVNHPIKRDLTDNVSPRVAPKNLEIDYQRKNWLAVFSI